EGERGVADRVDELGRVFRPPVEDAAQVDPRGEGAVATGDHDRVRGGEVADRRRRGAEQLDVERVDLAVLEADDGDAVLMVDPDHGALLRPRDGWWRPATPRRPRAEAPPPPMMP